MDEILESITNGQRRQALKQLSESAFDLSDLLEELTQEECVAIVRVAIRVGYISFNSANLRYF